jgi:hypothetical protein
MATANVVIRCSDPESVIAKLPAEFQEAAKIHYFDKGYAKRRYHDDPEFREKEKNRCRERNRKRYANDPAYRAKLAEQRKSKQTQSDDSGHCVGT